MSKEAQSGGEVKSWRGKIAWCEGPLRSLDKLRVVVGHAPNVQGDEWSQPNVRRVALSTHEEIAALSVLIMSQSHIHEHVFRVLIQAVELKGNAELGSGAWFDGQRFIGRELVICESGESE
jgi:hypothetical protein